jgi:hypothetical protein
VKNNEAPNIQVSQSSEAASELPIDDFQQNTFMMTTSHEIDAARSSDNTLDTLPADPEKQNHTSETQSYSEQNQNDAIWPDGDIQKGIAKPKAEAGPTAPALLNLMDPSSYPDGGLQAWLCVLGAFCALFVSFGPPQSPPCSMR